MAISPITTYDSFARTVASGWGTSDTGEVWTTSGPTFSVAGGYGVLAATANSARAFASINLGDTPLQFSSEIIMKVRYESSVAWPLTDFGLLLSYKESTKTGYYFSVQNNYSEVSIGVFINGNRYEIVRKSVSITKDRDYWLKFRLSDNTLSGKMWQAGLVEPSAWSVSGPLWSGAYPPSAGTGGMFKVGTRDSYTLRVSDVRYYTLEDVHPYEEPFDAFVRPNNTQGWGQSFSGHMWEGIGNDDPYYHLNPSIASIVSNNGRLTLATNTEVTGYLGVSKGGDQEAYAEFVITSIVGNNGAFRLGLRGTEGRDGGISRCIGYAAEFTNNGVLKLIKRSTITGAYTTLATNGSVGTSGTSFKMRFQIVGTTLQAKVWNSAATEPTEWQASATDATFASGKLWFAFDQEASASRIVSIGTIQRTAPTTVAVPNKVKVRDLASMTATDTSITVKARYYDDENDSSSITVRYKLKNSSTWTTWVGSPTVDRPDKSFTFTVSGLTTNSMYNIEVTFVDVDGTIGANPIMLTTATLAKRITAKSIAITASTPTSATVELSYDFDTDVDSTAIVEMRTTSTETRLIEDYFVDERDGAYLQNAESNHGGEWVKHPTMTPTVHAIRRNMYYYSNALVPSDSLLYTHTLSTPDAEYDIETKISAQMLHGRTGIAARVSPTQETYYGAGINGITNQWELFKVVNGVTTTLATTAFGGGLDLVYKLRLVVRNAYKAVMLNDVEILRSEDNSIATNGRTGYYAKDITQGSMSNQFTIGYIITSYRTAVGSFVSQGAMTADRPNKKFTKVLSGLTEDQTYEIRAVLSDPDGVIPPSTLSTTLSTVGKAVSLSMMGVSVSATSSILSIFYEKDTNSNSYMELQYKALQESIWTTVSFSNFRTDRTNRIFEVTLSGLMPSTTYSIRANVIDPDGIIEGGTSSLAAVFTTAGFVSTEATQNKLYLWKLYDKEGKYLTTIPDAPEPDFTLHENGGVTDLVLRLPRKMNEMASTGIIDFQHIVDIWAVDPSSQGMGPNLMDDPDCDPLVGGWVVGGEDFGQNASYDPTGGPDGSSAIKITQANSTEYETSSNPIEVSGGLPLIISCVARARGAKLRMFARAYNINDVALSGTSELAETVGTDWQKLSVNFIPPPETAYIRVLLENSGKGTMWADKFNVMAKETLVYRGRIETITPTINEEGETVEIEVLGLASLLSDDYIEFLQFVEVQPSDDVEANRPNFGAADPADMFKRVIDEAKRVNPMFNLYYTSDSIRYTGNLMQYTFRDQQVRSCLDKIRNLCPSGWHWFIEADGLVVLRGPDQAPTHRLRLGVEIQEFKVEKSIRNLKNYIRVKGRQDEDMSEADGHGSINYIAFDQASIDKYGKRVMFVRDAQLVDPESAKIVGDGRLDENNREEQRATCTIPDEKSFIYMGGSLRGYNIEAFRPGDNIVIVDPIAGARNTYWDQFKWNFANWDSSNEFMPLPEPVPIKQVRYNGDHVELELSERPPSQVGDFSRLYRWMANKDMED